MSRGRWADRDSQEVACLKTGTGPQRRGVPDPLTTGTGVPDRPSLIHSTFHAALPYGLQTIDGRDFHQDAVLFLIIHRAYVESSRSQCPVAVDCQRPALPPSTPPEQKTYRTQCAKPVDTKVTTICWLHLVIPPRDLSRGSWPPIRPSCSANLAHCAAGCSSATHPSITRKRVLGIAHVTQCLPWMQASFQQFLNCHVPGSACTWAGGMAVPRRLLPNSC